MLYLDATLVGEAYSRLRTAGANGAVVVAGLGDIRRGDEGAGVNVIGRLASEPRIPGVKLVSAGTRALRILPELGDARALVLVVAAHDGEPAGVVRYAAAASARTVPRVLVHCRWGLHALLSTAALCGELPPLHVYTISIAPPCGGRAGLSCAVEAGVAVTTCMIHGLARRLTAGGCPD